MLTPPAALHSAALSSSHSGPSSSGRQQRMSGAGGVVEQGLGKHVPVPMFVPPFRLRPLTRNFPRLRLAWIEAMATPCAFGSTPVGRKDCLTARPLAALGASATTARTSVVHPRILNMGVLLRWPAGRAGGM